MSYLPPTPALHRATFTLEFSDNPDDLTVVASASGESAYRRGRLWREAEVFTYADHDLRIAPADWVHHIALTVVQDRPNTTERLIWGLTGGLGVQDPLW